MGGDHMWIALGPVGLGSGVLPINVVVMEGIAVRAKTLVVDSSRRGEWVKQSLDYLPNAPVKPDYHFRQPTGDFRLLWRRSWLQCPKRPGNLLATRRYNPW